MKFQYLSDVHLEMGNRIPLTRSAEHLILAGDIGNPFSSTYSDFINNVSLMYKHVFIIAGNHEFYDTKQKRSMPETHEQIASVIKVNQSSKANVHYLNNTAYHFPNSDISVFGTTLWTHIPDCHKENIESSINDYNCIPDFSVELNNQLHQEAVYALKDHICAYPDRKWIVVCHHLPQTRLVLPMYQGLSINAAFATDVPIFDDDRIVAVVYGHTHTPSVQGKYYCNSFGYPKENINHNLGANFEI